MEGCGHCLALAHDYRIVPFCREDFYVGAELFDLGGADENHLDRRFAEPARTDGAIDLPTVRVTADANIQRAQPGLVRIRNFFREHNGPGAGAEGGLEAYKLFEFGEAPLAQDLQEGSGFAPGDYQTVDLVELFGLADTTSAPSSSRRFLWASKSPWIARTPTFMENP
jgi:hypothetical protein